MHDELAGDGFQRVLVRDGHAFATLQGDGSDPRVDLRFGRVRLGDVQRHSGCCLVCTMRHVPCGNVVVIVDPGVGIHPPGHLHVSVHRGQGVVLGLHGPNLIPLAAERLGRVRLHAGIHDHGFAIDIDHHLPDVIVVVALGIVPALRAHEKPIGRPGVVAGDKHLDFIQKHIARQWGRGLCVEDFIERKQRGQCAPHAPKRFGDALLGGALLTCGPRAQCHHGFVANALPIAIDHGKGGHHHRRRVGKVDEVLIGNLHAVDELADVLNQRLVVHVYRAAGRAVQPFQAVVERGTRAAPIARALVAPAIFGIGIDEMIHCLHRFEHRGNPARLIGFHQQIRGQPVRRDPRIPVVHARPRIAHPAKILAFQQRRQDAGLNFAGDAGDDQRRDRVELWAEQIRGPRQQLGGLCGEKIDNRLGGIGQPVAGLLHADVRGHAPKGLFADAPHAICNLVQKTTLALRAFGQHEIGQGSAPPKTQGFVARAVAIARIIQKVRCGHGRPVKIQAVFPACDLRLSNAVGQRLPRIAPGRGRKGPPVSAGNQNIAHPVFGMEL